MFKKVIGTYAVSFFTIGLYNGIMCYGLPKPKSFCDRLENSLLVGMIYICPITHPIILYKIFQRNKKRYLSIPLTKKDWYPLTIDN